MSKNIQPLGATIVPMAAGEARGRYPERRFYRTNAIFDPVRAAVYKASEAEGDTAFEFPNTPEGKKNAGRTYDVAKNVANKLSAAVDVYVTRDERGHYAAVITA